MSQTIAARDATIVSRDQTIADREAKIVNLESEVKRLNTLISQNGLESSELANRLAQSQKAVTDAEERIRKLTADLQAANQKGQKLEDEITKLKA
jgi:predicted  nucleic acid-binding Zn-ribbon protein